jgi:hypothetical protein
MEIKQGHIKDPKELDKNFEKTETKKKTKKKTAKKKVSKKTATRKASANQAQDYAHEIWLAGLGAFSMAQEEGGKFFKQGTKAIDDTRSKVVGESSKLFDRLVKEVVFVALLRQRVDQAAPMRLLAHVLNERLEPREVADGLRKRGKVEWAERVGIHGGTMEASCGAKSIRCGANSLHRVACLCHVFRRREQLYLVHSASKRRPSK